MIPSSSIFMIQSRISGSANKRLLIYQGKCLKLLLIQITKGEYLLLEASPKASSCKIYWKWI